MLVGLIAERHRLYCPGTMRILAGCAAAFLALAGVASSLPSERPLSHGDGLYDANPNHLWNRMSV
jgi:hypothetical protein